MHTNNRHTHSAQECYVFLLIILLYSLRVWDEYVWIRAACYARAYTTFDDVTASTVRHWLKSYGLAVQARGCPPGSDVPRSTIDQSAHDFSLLSLSRVPCTVGCPIPVPRKRGVLWATASMFSTYTVFIFLPTNVCTLDSASVSLF